MKPTCCSSSHRWRRIHAKEIQPALLARNASHLQAAAAEAFRHSGL